MEIELKEALRQFKAGGVYSLKVVAADLKRKTGGEILIFEKAKYALTESKKAKKQEGKAGAKDAGQPSKTKGALNIWDGQRGQIVTIHARLMVEFDGKEIIW